MRIAAAVAVSLALVNAASAAERPAVEIPTEVPRGEVRTFKLENGLEVTFLPFGDIPKAAVSLAIRAANVDEDEHQTWLSDFTGQLMQLGTDRLDAAALARTAAGWGGSLGVNVSPDTMTISGTVLAEHAPDLVGLIAEVAAKPKLPASEVPRIQADMVRMLELFKSQPGSIADAKLAGVTYPKQVYGRYFPTAAMLRGYTAEQARAFHERFVHAGRAHLYVAGRFDAAATEAGVRAAFGGWRGGPPAVAPVLKPATTRKIHFVERGGSVQSVVRVAAPAVPPTHPDYVPLVVTNTLLGGAFISRITQNIREAKGYAYSPHGSVTARVGDTYWHYNADVTTNVTGPALREILGELARLAKEPPSAEELRGIQRYMIGTFLVAQSSRDGRLGWQRFLDLHGLPADFDYVAAVRAVTPEKVTEMTHKYLDRKKLTMVVVGDGKQVLPQLKGIAPIEK